MQERNAKLANNNLGGLVNYNYLIVIIIYDTYTYYREGPPRRASDFKQKLFTACEYFLKFVIVFLC